MKIRTLLLGGLGAVAAGCFRVQTIQTSAGPVAVRQATSDGTIPAGMLLRGKLNTTIGISTSHAKDVVGITLDAVKAGSITVVPAGAMAYGHIITVSAGAPGDVQIAFDSLTFAGHSHVLDANVASTGATGVSVKPIDSTGLGANTVASATKIGFGSGGQLPSGSAITLIVVSAIRSGP